MFTDIIEPDLDIGQLIESQTNAHSHICWTCGTCDNECPVFRATDRLRPQKTVRMANLGMMDDLLNLADVWYCISCRRCLQGCPNSVKPYELHRYLRNEAILRGIVSTEINASYRQLFIEFQRVRWRAVAHCMKAGLESLTIDEWYHWLKTPIHNRRFEVIKPAPLLSSNGQACFTCSECTNCCPIFSDRSVFDPQRIIRMAAFGMTEKVIRFPDIWLCLGCQRCTDNCSQLVRGHEIIRYFQDMAVAEGIVDDQFFRRLVEADRIIYPHLLNEIDTLLGMFSNIT